MTGAISDCNLMLYVVAERYPPAQKYRDVFDRIKMNVTKEVARGSHQSSKTTGILDPEMTERCRALSQGLSDTVRTDYSQIIGDLAKDDQSTHSHGSLHSVAGDIGAPVVDYDQFNFGMLSGPITDFGIANSHEAFVEPTFMYDFGNFNSLMTTDWDSFDASI